VKPDADRAMFFRPFLWRLGSFLMRLGRRLDGLGRWILRRSSPRFRCPVCGVPEGGLCRHPPAPEDVMRAWRDRAMCEIERYRAVTHSLSTARPSREVEPMEPTP